ncbi:MAG: 2-isopropylmalate synthase [Candidatus Auribacterota bacterium]|jgi:isopropylmalate/homocitrate/citramalate synthase|nr:2-isopropylmalate synthase [Candidatus Auribacterota bacterium]
MKKKRNLIEPKQIKYDVKDTTEPDLYDELFDYDQVCKVSFDHIPVPMEMPEKIWITDTTFRDGQQARPPYTVDQIVHIYDLMHRLGGKNGVIRQSEFFLYSPTDREAVEKCLEKGYQFPEITGWIRAVKQDFQRVKELGLKETGILTSASDYHIFLKLKKSRTEAIEGYLDVVRASLDAGIIPRCHLEDITRADFYGVILPFVQKLMQLSQESGIPIKIRACDTMGYGVPWSEAALPRSVPKLIHGLVHEGGVPPEQLEWHGHNDFHKVLVDATTAWLYGCCAANGTLLGFGERTGNPPIEALIIDYISLVGHQDGIDTTVITEMAEYFRDEIKVSIPANFPFVGDDFNTTRAGIHADGVTKDERIYNIFNTEKLLNRPLGVTITNVSGTAGIAHWVNTTLRLKGDKRIDKRHPGIMKMYQWVSDQYDNARITGISNEEMLEQARIHLPEYVS